MLLYFLLDSSTSIILWLIKYLGLGIMDGTLEIYKMESYEHLLNLSHFVSNYTQDSVTITLQKREIGKN